MAPSRIWLGVAVFGIGAVVSAVWAYHNIQPLMVADISETGATPKASAFELLQYFVPPLVAFWLARRVRGRGHLARRVRQAHVRTTVGWIVCVGFLSMLALSTNTGILWLIAMYGTVLGGALWLPVQTLFSAAFLGLLIRGKHRVRRPAFEPPVTVAN